MRPAAVGDWVAARLKARADRAGRLVAGQQALAGGHHGGGGGAQLLGVLAIVDRRSVGRAHHDGAAANDRWGRAKVERERGADEGEHDRANGEGTGITVDSTSCDRGRRVPGSLGHHWGEHGTANVVTADAACRPGAPPHRPHPRRSRRVRCQAPRCRPPPRGDRMLDSARVVACSSCGISMFRCKLRSSVYFPPVGAFLACFPRRAGGNQDGGSWRNAAWRLLSRGHERLGTRAARGTAHTPATAAPRHGVQLHGAGAARGRGRRPSRSDAIGCPRGARAGGSDRRGGAAALVLRVAAV